MNPPYELKVKRRYLSGGKNWYQFIPEEVYPAAPGSAFGQK